MCERRAHELKRDGAERFSCWNRHQTVSDGLFLQSIAIAHRWWYVVFFFFLFLFLNHIAKFNKEFKKIYLYLIRFLFAATAHESIFERPCFPNDLYKVRDGIKFHLYINTAPCGDARIFCPHDNNTSADKYPMR